MTTTTEDRRLTTDATAGDALLAHLHRGGAWAHYWTDTGKESLWYPVGNRPPIPAKWAGQNVYFSVHPCRETPPTNSKGESTPPRAVRVQNDYVAAVNCFFAEFDAKEWEGGKEAIRAHLDGFPQKRGWPYPSVIVDSGGGYHCYWLLEHTVTITDDNRENLKRVQAAWVGLVGGDEGAKDFARVLRVPGTQNVKPAYGPDFPIVTSIEANYGRLYGLEDFEQLTEHLRSEPLPTPAQPTHPNGHYTFTDDLTKAAANLKRLRPGRADDYQEWVNVGMALCSLGAAGLGLWEDWSQQSSKYRLGECSKKWPGFTPGDGLGLGSLAHWADEDDPNGRRVYVNGNGPSQDGPSQDAGPVDVSRETIDPLNEDEDEIEPHPLDVETPPLALGWIDEYADLMTKLTGSPREFNLACGLVTAAAAIQRKARLRMSFADIYPNIYAAIVARSSVYHKSSALHKPRALLQRAMLDRLMLSELMTSEGLLAQLQGQSSGVVVRDEIGTLFDSHRVKYLRTLKPDLTALYDCLPYSRRLSNLEIKVDAPYLNILGATTPARFYDAITATDWQDGFMARWLFVLPESEPDFDAMTGLYEEKHDAEIGRLAVALQNLDRQREQDFALAGDAFTLWDDWQRQAAKDAYYYGDDTIAAVVTRYSAYALKFSLILAAVNGEWGRVTAETMQTAIHLADSFKRSVARLLREKDDHLVSGAQLQKVFKAIQLLNSDGKGVTTKSILQRTGMRKAQLTPSLEKLTEIGAIAYQPAGNGFRYWAMTEELPIRTWK